MINQVEKLAKNVDEAIESALQDLGADFDDVVIEVLDEGDQGGLLGFGRRPARVRVTLADTEFDQNATMPETHHSDDYYADGDERDDDFTKYDDEEEYTDGNDCDRDDYGYENDEYENEEYENDDYGDGDYADDDYDDFDDDYAVDDYDDDYDEDDLDVEDNSDFAADNAGGTRRKPRRRPRRERQSYGVEDRERLEEAAVEYIATIMQNLGTHGRISSYFADDGSLHVDVTGENLGNAIGRRGETLDAIQYLATLAINQDHDRYQRLFVDIDSYRDRRMRQLRHNARKSAERVLKSGRRYVMSPMSPAERRQIHLALSDFQGITTYSEGREPKRSVVIAREDK